MPILDIFRNIFGFNNNNQDQFFRPENNSKQENNFRKPIWENDDDDDDYNSDFRDPFEMNRNFESQIESIMKSFFGGFSGQTGGFFGQFGIHSPHAEFALPSPPEFSEPGQILEDEVLKRKFDTIEAQLKNQGRVDSDLDGKLSDEELMKFWQNSKEQKIESEKKAQNSFYQASSTQITSRNGILEKRQTFKDSDGNKQTIVRRELGDKVHEIVTKVDKNGVETKTENFVNMDENDISKFETNWKSSLIQDPKNELNSRNRFPWHEFFGPGPKL